MRPAAVLLAAAPLLFAACGGSSSSKQLNLTPVAYVKQAAQKSAQASSEHVDLNATATVQGNPFSLTGAGDFDNAKKSGDMTVHANLQGLDMQIDEVLDGTTIYVRSPLFSAGLPAGKSWLKLDLQKVGKAQGVDLSQLMGQDPSQSFAQLQASGQVTKVGDETIDGVDTTHYRGKIDLSKLPAAAKIKALAKAKYGPYDVWIGTDDGYVHRVKTSYTLGQQAFGLTMSFSDFGKDVSVTVPAANETVDATNKSLQGLGG
jgi:LppX/LprAFG-like lipoprotein